MTPPANRREGGYALLLVYAMAASVAIMLYMEVPRVAFEAQRDKEQLLIDRGEQYSRAIQLYVRKYNRFPVDMQALENTQGIRFLRRQYTDPMTGKSEWRIIHVGPGGVFTDSLVQKKKAAGEPQTFITELQQMDGGGGAGQGTDGVNLATRRRPSDGPGAQSDPFAIGGPSQSQAQSGTQPAAGQPGAQPAPYTGPVMVLPDGRIVPATATGVPAPDPAPAPGRGPSGAPVPGGPLPNGVGIQTGNLPPGFQNQPNFQSQGGGPAPPPPNAVNLINQILTTPRPGGMNGEQQGGFGQPIQGAFGGAGGAFGTPVQGAAGGQIIGGGIAGIASKMEREGIKVYNERSAYNEWEFVYDMAKDMMRGGGRGGVLPQGSGQSVGQPIGQPVGQSPLQPGNVPVSTPRR